MRAFFIILVSMFAVSCSKSEAKKTTADVKAAAQSIARDPQVRTAEADVKRGAKEAVVEIKKGAIQAKAGIEKAGAEAKRSADEATDGKKS